MKYSVSFLLILVLAVFFSSGPAYAKKSKFRSTQEVNLDGDSVDGVVRNPYGAYLSQKRGVQFMPLYKVREAFDENIKQSVEYLK